MDYCYHRVSVLLSDPQPLTQKDSICAFDYEVLLALRLL